MVSYSAAVRAETETAKCSADVDSKNQASVFSSNYTPITVIQVDNVPGT